MTAACLALHSEHRKSIHSLTEREREIHLYAETHHMTSASESIVMHYGPESVTLSYAGGVRELREVSDRPGVLHVLTAQLVWRCNSDALHCELVIKVARVRL